MRFCAAVGVPEKSGVARLFKVFATAVLANFQDRLVMTASIPLRMAENQLTPYSIAYPEGKVKVVVEIYGWR